MFQYFSSTVKWCDILLAFVQMLGDLCIMHIYVVVFSELVSCYVNKDKMFD